MSPRGGYPLWLVFGAVWGIWGAQLPQLKAQAHVDDGQLGVALLFIGLGALPAMAWIGRAVDRWGRATAAAAITAFGLSAVGVALVARDPVSLSAGLFVLGATSGAADVSINALASAAERAASRPIIARSHATFSAAVVLGSVAAGALRLAGAPLSLPFALAAGGGLLAAGYLLRVPDPLAELSTIAAPPAGTDRHLLVALIPAGLVAALALAIENAHQNWSAVFLTDDLHVRSGWSAAAPALFAAVVALVRFAIGPLTRRAPIAVLVTGGSAAAAGTLVVAVAHDPGLALAGLAVAAAGTGALYPTLLSLSLRDVDAAVRGRATSAVAASAYLGFVLGPVFVGAIATVSGLRGAFVGIAGLAVAFTVLAGPVSRRIRRATGA